MKKTTIHDRYIYGMQEAKRIREGQNRIYDYYFRHLYVNRGFNVGMRTQEKNSRHACMDFGYWCADQINEQGLIVIIPFILNRLWRIKSSIYRLFK